ncbi:MAG: formylglycine-generating enzyme family protein [Burkholderiales bacterium]
MHGLALAGSVALLSALAAGTSFRDCDVCPVMIVLPAGSFEMGSAASDPARTEDEQPRHRVSFARPFAVAKFSVTRGEFARFVAESGYRVAPGCLIRRSGGWVDDRRAGWRRPGFAQTDLDPVVCMSWNDGQAYADWLSRKTGHAYALLTEAQWEYAARAGTTTPYYWGAQASRAYANYGTERCCDPAAAGKDRWLHTAPSGSFPPNAFGLYDMHGNAWQWMQDCWHRNYDGAPADGSAWLSGSCVDRVMRGGSWNCGTSTIRAAEREVHDLSGRYSVVGFRVARTD